jgi:peptide-methionine (R)-S-oxide reductase
MTRREALRTLFATTAAIPAWATIGAFSRARVAFSAAKSSMQSTEKPAKKMEKLDKPLVEWRKLLDDDRYAILFKEDTERPFSSPLNAEKRPGTFLCAACFLPLFSSAAKFESGTGWPSFTEPLAGHIETKRDWKLVLPRTEYHCIRCGGHQGHVFDDGPPPTGQRWCNNGLALLFVPEGEALPELRT